MICTSKTQQVIPLYADTLLFVFTLSYIKSISTIDEILKLQTLFLRSSTEKLKNWIIFMPVFMTGK